MKTFKMPSALSIVMIFLAIVAILTWIVPTSVVVTDDDGNKVIHYNAAFDGDGNVVEDAGTDPVGLWDFFIVPIQGLISAADVAATIFISGGFLAILNHTGALDAGISALVKKFKGSVLIAILMFVFALMGTVYGACEELPAYAIVIIPLFVAAGYDVITGMMVILIGAGIGNMASIVNPYSIGAAISAIGNEELSMGDGILLRLVLFVVLLAMGVVMVTRYAAKVKRDPKASCVAHLDDINTRVDGDNAAAEVKMTGRQKAALVVFGIMVLICVIGYIPWDAIPMGNGTAFDLINGLQYKMQGTFIGNLLGANNFCELGWWYFNEFSCVWLIGAVVVGVIAKIPEKTFVSVFTSGCKDLMGVVLVLATARGISIFMGSKTYGMSITFIYWIQKLLTGVPLWAFVIAAVLVYLLIGIFLQSTSGVAGITMPIFGAIAFGLFASSGAGSIGGQVVLLSAFTCGINFMSCVYPSATNMGVCELVNVPYNVFLKQWAKILVPILAVSALIISVAPYIGLT